MNDKTKTDKPAPIALGDLSDASIQAARNEAAAQAVRDQGPDDDEGEGEITEIAAVDVLIFRNEFASIPDTVFAHELPVLRLLHGEDMVKVTREHSMDVEDFDANDELARLQRKYNSKEGDPVSVIFANDPRRLATEAGVSFRSGPARKPAASEQSAAPAKTVLKKQR